MNVQIRAGRRAVQPFAKRLKGKACAWRAVCAEPPRAYAHAIPKHRNAHACTNAHTRAHPCTYCTYCTFKNNQRVTRETHCTSDCTPCTEAETQLRAGACWANSIAARLTSAICSDGQVRRARSYKSGTGKIMQSSVLIPRSHQAPVDQHDHLTDITPCLALIDAVFATLQPTHGGRG